MSREESIFKGQALNLSLQIMIAQGRVPDKMSLNKDDEMKVFLKELFKLAKQVFETGKKENFVEAER